MKTLYLELDLAPEISTTLYVRVIPLRGGYHAWSEANCGADYPDAS